MGLTDLIVHAGVEQNAFGRGGLARVNVGRDTDVAVTRDRSLTSHLVVLYGKPHTIGKDRVRQ